MDFDEIIDKAKKLRESEHDDLKKVSEDFLTSSTVVMGNAELVREGRREDAELAAAVVAATDPT